MELWWSDGTLAGTRLVADLAPGAAPSNPHDMTVAGATLFWIADPGGLGARLWAMDLPLAGEVPDGAGVRGVPLMARKAGAGIVRLDWGVSCVARDDDYAVYEGQIGDFTSHAPVTCSTAGATTAFVATAAGDRYYLVSALSADGFEGSLGRRSNGVERPPGPAPCRPRAAASCN